MLDPENRHLLLKSVQPEPGWRLDLAVGTSFTLDLLSLMTVPVGMARYDREHGDGAMLEDPVAMLQALRDLSSRITLFSQAGQVAVPREYRRLLVYLEDSVYPVSAPRAGGIFHPKVWFIRYLDRDDRPSYRLLCLTRNLTFSRSWDTVLRLDGTPGGKERWSTLETFVEALPGMAADTRPVPPDRTAAIRQLGSELAAVDWNLPAGFEELDFIGLGHDGSAEWPFPRETRMLVMSPFVTSETLRCLTGDTTSSVLISRAESLDALGKGELDHLAERLVLSPDAAMADDEVEHRSTDEAVGEGTTVDLNGLHAKLYVAEDGDRTTYWTGSANATDAAFGVNVEFLVKLGGSTSACGIDTLIGEPEQRSTLGLRSLLESYTPANDEPLEPDEREKLLRRLAEVARHVSSLAYTASCTPLEQHESWHVRLVGDTGCRNVYARIPTDATVGIRPLTLADEAAVPLDVKDGNLTAEFTVSPDAITPFFVLTVASGDQAQASLITATLHNPPAGRAERVMGEILANPADLIRFLLLLLGDTEAGLAATDDEAGGGGADDGGWLAALGYDALLEPLIRAYARDPERIQEIDRVLTGIAKATDGDVTMPAGWDAIWEPLKEALRWKATP